MDKLLIATNNKGKLKEIKSLLGNRYNVVSLNDCNIIHDVIEDKDTFFGNAYKKAQELTTLSGLVTLADDSGLVVPSLDMQPGVYSARFAGMHGIHGENVTENNNKLLLQMMENSIDRRAYFCCVMVLCYPDGRYYTAEGRTEGEILEAPQGNKGFGYDPIFYSYDLKKSFGIASDEEKNAVSHRARALQALLSQL